MGNKKGVQFPVRLWLGKYSQWLLVMKGGDVLRKHDRVIERFLSTFPSKLGLEEFSSIDAADYRTIRESQGVSNRKLYEELLILRAFWRWLTIDAGLPILKIKRAFDSHVEQAIVSKRAGISLDCVKRLLRECDERSREVVLGLLSSSGVALPRGSRAAKIEIAARKAGLRNFSLKKLRTFTTNRLTKDIVQTYLDQLRDTFTSKSKTSCDSFTGIQLTAPDIRPAICDSTYTSSAVSGVDK